MMGQAVVCAHIIVHTDECGYREPALEQECTHVHDEGCYTTETDCIHAHTAECYSNPDYDPDAKEQYKIDDNGNKINVMDKLIPSTELVPLRVPFAATAPTKENGGYNDTTKEYAWQAGDAVYDLLGPAGADSTARKNYSLMDADYDKDTGALGDLPEGVGGKMQPDGTVEDMANAYDGPLPDMSGKLVTLNGLSINSNGAITGVAENGDTVVIGYAAIGKVTAPDGVTHIGGPYYKAMEGAGEMNVGIAGGLLEPGTYLNNQRITEDATPASRTSWPRTRATRSATAAWSPPPRTWLPSSPT